MTQDATPTPAVVRRLDSTAAMAMADLAAIFEDLQTTLRCCERLVSELASGEAEPDDLSGDLIVQLPGQQGGQLELPNVLFAEWKVKQVADLMKTRPIVTE